MAEKIVLIFAAGISILFLPLVLFEIAVNEYEIRKAQGRLKPPTKEEWKQL
uniref:Uncharacterized protein n=1 Tax=uncultured bacterium Contig643 TaxID=1393602 RepID=W0FH71_9BACT|nr:hypothetical protein [uncultured bacterium Contig643]